MRTAIGGLIVSAFLVVGCETGNTNGTGTGRDSMSPGRDVPSQSGRPGGMDRPTGSMGTGSSGGVGGSGGSGTSGVGGGSGGTIGNPGQGGAGSSSGSSGSTGGGTGAGR